MIRWVAVLALVVAGCGGGSDFTSPQPVGCTPGEQKECSCTGGAKSTQTCNADGAGFSECECGGDAALSCPAPCAATQDCVITNRVASCKSTTGAPCTASAECNAAAGLECVPSNTCQVPHIVGGGESCAGLDAVCVAGYHCDATKHCSID